MEEAAADDEGPGFLALFLGDAGGRAGRSLPSTAAVADLPSKLQAPSAADDEQTHIDVLLGAYGRLLSVPPKKARKSCAGLLLPGAAQAAVARPVDTVSRTSGRTLGGTTYLQPEEWLLFVERGTLVVTRQDEQGKAQVLGSLDAWAAALGDAGLSLDVYRGYAHLRRLGHVHGSRGWAVHRRDVFRGLLALGPRAGPLPQGLRAGLPAPPTARCLVSSYDVYTPAHPYTKRAPGPPQFQMAVECTHAPFPAARELCELTHAARQTPVILAASEPGGTVLLKAQAFEICQL
ncbi:hypothetical protein LPJ61_000566 [Coemansia biformis]|uniref:tRNA-splicing endonuclease subunit Sen54 N-terminal domain-containing protein n=1 Tax=Coemansia biformis TaxID=1286918 RepID=A0A9W8D1H9_9FUNG|nr:hypothetical protein LPJ61_000566 [Coemansia biformis]